MGCACVCVCRGEGRVCLCMCVGGERECLCECGVGIFLYVGEGVGECVWASACVRGEDKEGCYCNSVSVYHHWIADMCSCTDSNFLPTEKCV